MINLKPISEAIRCARMHGDNALIAELCNLMDDITMERFKRIERQLWHVMDDIALSDLKEWVEHIESSKMQKQKMIEDVTAIIHQNACCDFNVEIAVEKLIELGYIAI